MCTSSAAPLMISFVRLNIRLVSAASVASARELNHQAFGTPSFHLKVGFMMNFQRIEDSYQPDGYTSV